MYFESLLMDTDKVFVAQTLHYFSSWEDTGNFCASFDQLRKNGHLLKN